jgi:type III restriction enzyme
MADLVIENPVINSPYVEPGRHFVFAHDGIANEIADGRLESTFFVPIAPVRKRGHSLCLTPNGRSTACGHPRSVVL